MAGELHCLGGLIEFGCFTKMDIAFAWAMAYEAGWYLSSDLASSNADAANVELENMRRDVAVKLGEEAFHEKPLCIVGVKDVLEAIGQVFIVSKSKNTETE